MTIFELISDERTVHTFFDRDLAPLLTVGPGDSVRYRLLDAGSRLARPDRLEVVQRLTASPGDLRLAIVHRLGEVPVGEAQSAWTCGDPASLPGRHERGAGRARPAYDHPAAPRRWQH